MLSIPISQVPNQSVAFNADGAYWQLHIFQAVESMCVDIKRNGVDIVSGMRIFVGLPFMPYEYMHAPLYGNFVLDGDADWTLFGSGTELYYLTATELAEYVAATGV